MRSALVLFTPDLRVRDKASLATAAAEADAVAPLFVFDERLLKGAPGSPNRVVHLLDCLQDLYESLRERGARLLTRRGDPLAEAIARGGLGGSACEEVAAR